MNARNRLNLAAVKKRDDPVPPHLARHDPVRLQGAPRGLIHQLKSLGQLPLNIDHWTAAAAAAAGMVRYGMVWSVVVWIVMVWYGVLRYGVVSCRVVWYGTWYVMVWGGVLHGYYTSGVIYHEPYIIKSNVG